MTPGETLVNPVVLRQWFEMVIDCYRVDRAGFSLATLLRRDWNLFQHPEMDDANAGKLIGDIFEDEDMARRGFSPIEWLNAESPQRWDDLRDEMMHRNRWFLDEPMDLDQLGELLDLLMIPGDELFDVWYRARLLSDTKPYPLDQMGAPQSHLAGHGRANPAGIRYLYVGSKPVTAIAEIRPHTGETACVAKFELRSKLRVIDLRNPRFRVSPFILEDADQIARIRSGLPLLERLGDELTKPVEPRSAAFEYIPSQYFCEFIKKRGFQGVLYGSSVSDGMNLALFDPDLARGIEVTTANVDSVSVHISGVNWAVRDVPQDSTG